MTKAINTALLWAPRILLILLISLFSILSLDVFSMDAPIFNKIGGYLIQMIPSFCMVAILVLSWKKPFVGGLLCIALSIIFTIFFKTYRDIGSFLAITGLPAVCGVLFLYSDKKTKKK